MEKIKFFLAVSTLSIVSFSTQAKYVSVTATTLSDAEAKIIEIAKREGASSYFITSANTKERVYMTARLKK